MALRLGLRELPGNSSLSDFLYRHFGHRNRLVPPILEWANLHRNRMDKWTTNASGKVFDAEGETWLAIEAALRRGSRGLPKGLTLRRLFLNERVKRLQRPAKTPSTTSIE